MKQNRAGAPLKSDYSGVYRVMFFIRRHWLKILIFGGWGLMLLVSFCTTMVNTYSERSFDDICTVPIDENTRVRFYRGILEGEEESCVVDDPELLEEFFTYLRQYRYKHRDEYHSLYGDAWVNRSSFKGYYYFEVEWRRSYCYFYLESNRLERDDSNGFFIRRNGEQVELTEDFISAYWEKLPWGKRADDEELWKRKFQVRMTWE
ncbi:hypothetical protein [Feifania hominis]|uniref:Uncharacterized protein n=1 Tax=Feifania hominis TaxID=2763660 RepID=A0A926DFB9_9FIRM|nr:hypothetical protein [Feifania hominis]MBC8536769.1 hypothetical protein [Feifania hominis]